MKCGLQRAFFQGTSLRWIEKCSFHQSPWWFLCSLRLSDYCWIFKWAIHPAAEHLLSLLSFTGSQCDAQLFWTLFLLLLHNWEGEVWPLFTEEGLVMPWNVTDLAFHLCKVWDGILAMMSKRKESRGLWLPSGTVHSASPSMIVTDWPHMLIFSIVPGATASLKPSLCLCNI